MNNYLSASPLIITRIQQQLPDLPALHIRPAISLDWLVKSALSPSVNVVFFDDVPEPMPGGQALRGKSQASVQLWLIVLTTRNVADQGNSVRQDAGPLLHDVLMALQGWKPSAAHGELYRRRCPFRATDLNGHVHIPLLFSTKVVTVAAPI